MAANQAYRNARDNSDVENTRIEFDKALRQVVTSMIKDDNQLFKQFVDNDGFKRWMTDAVFQLISVQAEAS